MNKELRSKLIEFMLDSGKFKDSFYWKWFHEFESFEENAKDNLEYKQMNYSFHQDINKVWERVISGEFNHIYSPTISCRATAIEGPKKYDQEVPSFVVEWEKKIDPTESHDRDYSRAKNLVKDCLEFKNKALFPSYFKNLEQEIHELTLILEKIKEWS